MWSTFLSPKLISLILFEIYANHSLRIIWVAVCNFASLHPSDRPATFWRKLGGTEGRDMQARQTPTTGVKELASPKGVESITQRVVDTDNGGRESVTHVVESVTQRVVDTGNGERKRHLLCSIPPETLTSDKSFGR